MEGTRFLSSELTLLRGLGCVWRLTKAEADRTQGNRLGNSLEGTVVSRAFRGRTWGLAWAGKGSDIQFAHDQTCQELGIEIG